MPRLELKALPSYEFATELTVRTTDLNYGGHLSNDRVLALAHEARVEYLASHGFTESDCGGASLIMADAGLRFLGESFAGDRLRVEVSAGEAGRSGFRLFYRFTQFEGGRDVALVETGMVFFDYEQRKVISMPEAVRSLFPMDLQHKN